MSTVSVVELVWVLSASDRLTRSQVVRALRMFDAGHSDFADCLIERTCGHDGCDHTVTGDLQASTHPGMALIG